MTDKRFIELESRLAFMDHNVEALNAALAAQQQRLDQLERACMELLERTRGLNAERPRTAQEERPPHY